MTSNPPLCVYVSSTANNAARSTSQTRRLRWMIGTRCDRNHAIAASRGLPAAVTSNRKSAATSSSNRKRGSVTVARRPRIRRYGPGRRRVLDRSPLRGDATARRPYRLLCEKWSAAERPPPARVEPVSNLAVDANLVMSWRQISVDRKLLSTSNCVSSIT